MAVNYLIGSDKYSIEISSVELKKLALINGRGQAHTTTWFLIKKS